MKTRIQHPWLNTGPRESNLSPLKLSLDAIKIAIKAEQEAEALKAEPHRNQFLFDP